MLFIGVPVLQVVFDKYQQKVYVKMVSTLNLEEKYNRVRRNFCFYLDIQDHGLARSISRRIQDMGLQQEVFLTSRVTHVVGSRAGGPAAGRPRRAERPERRADAMLRRVAAAPPAAPQAPQPRHAYVTLTVQKAISLLDKLYDTFFTAPRKAHVRFFTKHFIKIEFLDKLCRPVFKEFDEWPEISLEPDPPRDKKDKKESPEQTANNNQTPNNTASQKMTRKSRPRIKEKEEKETKAGYCEMCHAEYADAALHRRSPHHAAFVRDHNNFFALDSLISSGADVASFLDKTAVNGERRSLRKLCNGDVEPRPKRRRSRSPDPAPDGDRSPRRNGGLDDDRRPTRGARRGDRPSDDRQYYKVVGVSTKLRSSGGFASKRRDSPPPCNGTKPLVVKFRKIRRSELSVLSDEAEQFMFPKRASSSSSTSTDDDEDDDDKAIVAKRRSPPKPLTTPVERRRLARPVYAMKEESSEEDSWPEDKRRRKRKPPTVARRGRRAGLTRASAAGDRKEEEEEKAVEATLPQVEVTVPLEPPGEVSPLREEPVERCMKWEDGRLKYTPAVEQLEFAFESVPRSEPWFETFRRQDQDEVAVKNVPKYFALYSTSKAPKLPYEIGQLPPLKPNCCPLSDLVKRDEKPGPSRAYGTRNMKKQRIRKRTAAVQALEAHPRKSPREHASTLAILGSAGLLHRRKHADDTKSTASEDTVSDALSTVKAEPVVSEAQEASERLRQFLSEVFEEAAEFDMSDETIEGDTPLIPSTNPPDVSSLVSECEGCDIIRNEIEAGEANRARGRRGKFKKKNRTGWPSKRKPKKGSRASSADAERKASDGASSADDTAPSTAGEDAPDDDATLSEAERTLEPARSDRGSAAEDDAGEPTDDDEPLRLDLKVVVQEEPAASPEKDGKRSSRSSLSESEDREIRKKKRALQGLLLQPVVRVARVDAGVARRLRSGGRGRRGKRGARHR